ncbi:alpha/beta fold hydrolase [Asanoa siamensis]|uniref:Alpha/beta hydrolase n=1 Tax=Asanoa siamensis TaxID=926357 RepID=A0ABQ4CXS7_9ACTN|nr:alpha/beta hydrolase [Asanoa siamensis]GIF76092.1 hypothetical protein Asi02nite_56100 [Asanoa siamensis]
MTTARTHDGTTIDVTVRGAGPTVLIPVSTTPIEGEAAERLRAWGADPALGHNLVTGLVEAGFRVVSADYEGHLADHPKPDTLTPDTVAADLLAVADAAGAERFAYYGYSWLALSGLQLALRTDRLTALAMGGYPPLGGPSDAMLTVTNATYAMAMANERRTRVEPESAPTARLLSPTPSDGTAGQNPNSTDDASVASAEPGDWDAAEVTISPERARQFVTLYESLRGFDERSALARLTVPRLAFAGADDNITYSPKWGDAYVAIGEALTAHRAELEASGWTVTIVPGADHMSAMRAETVLPILAPWLTRSTPQAAGTSPR